MERVEVRGDGLTVDVLIRVARGGAPVKCSADESVLSRLRHARNFVTEAVEQGRPIYGITTSFGGMSNIEIPNSEVELLQRSAVWSHKVGAGQDLPVDYTRAAMLLRMNSHVRGTSGVSLELIERLAAFLNEHVTPVVPEFGSIGASGDLVPLAYVTGSIIGLDACFQVDFAGERMDSRSALARLNLPPVSLGAKEALAMMNGTSFSTAIAAMCIHDGSELLTVGLGFHALALQALRGSLQSFESFIHQQKPHAGQGWVASEMRALLEGSRMVRKETDGVYGDRRGDLIQDRYSLRCLPQFLGPTAEALDHMRRQIEVEMNSTTDNPLIDSEAGASYHGGNFLAQYVGLAMDQLRQHLGLCTKYIDVQIALLMSPEFSNGLPASLAGNPARRSNIGLKGLQLLGNSIMPLVTFLGAPLVDRFPSHAEQFNQNINSQSFGAANLARQSISLVRKHVALALLSGIQAVDLRNFIIVGHYDAREMLSPRTRRLYEQVREIVGRPPHRDRPYVWNDDEQALDSHIAAVEQDLERGGRIRAALSGIRIFAGAS